MTNRYLYWLVVMPLVTLAAVVVHLWFGVYWLYHKFRGTL